MAIERLSRFASGALLALLATGGPAEASDWRACDNISYRPLEFTVPACTRLIEQGALGGAELRRALRRRADALYFGSSFLSPEDGEERTRLLEQALADLDRVMATDTGGAAAADPPIWLGPPEIARADVLYGLGRFEAAVDAYSGAMARRPEAASHARFGRALALGNLGRFEEALADMSELVRLHPDEERKWVFLRGEMHAKAGRAAAARADFRRVLGLDPDHVGARRGLERLGGAAPPD